MLRPVAAMSGRTLTRAGLRAFATKLPRQRQTSGSAILASRIASEGYDPACLKMHNYKALDLKKRGKKQEAEEMLSNIVKMRETEMGQDDTFTVSAENDLAITLGENGKHGEAVAMFKKVLQSIEKQHGDETLPTLSTRKRLAMELLAEVQDDLKQATVLLKTTLAEMETAFGQTHPETRATRRKLAGALEMQGHSSEAKQLLAQDEENDLV